MTNVWLDVHFFAIYMVLWGIACLIAAYLMLKLRQSLDLFSKDYWDALFQRWKIATFVVATTGITVVAPYTGDPTWDYIDAMFMSILAYCTAPWTVGTLYLSIRGKRDFPVSYIALCIWLFSVSWSYDLYLLVRDGYYPITWLWNIPASSILYVAAGLFWSLEYIEGRGVIFGFMDPDWPRIKSGRQYVNIIWYALPLAALVTVIISSFLI